MNSFSISEYVHTEHKGMALSLYRFTFWARKFILTSIIDHFKMITSIACMLNLCGVMNFSICSRRVCETFQH